MQMADDNLFLIDIDKVLQEKAPDTYRRIPRPLVAYLKHIVHQEEINEFLRTHQDAVGVDFLEQALDYLDTHLVVHGRENLPSDGRPCTFVSNHPLGGQDGLALGFILGRHYDGRVKYLVNDLLMNLHPLAPLFIPINKTGRQAKDFPAQVRGAFASGDHIIMFPAGLCSRRQKGIGIRDLEWKKTFVTRSVEARRDVVPIHFEGRNSNRFYRLANLCKRLGLKVNIAMMYLADEMYKNRHKTFTVSIGQPIPWQTFDRSRSDKEWAQWVKEKVYSLE